MKDWIPKVAVSVGALIFLGAHLTWPAVPIDAVALALLLLAVLPWLSSLIKSAEFPGGWKIEFRDLQAAGAKVTQPAAAEKAMSPSATPSYLEVSDRDPNLAIVGLRIEIEKRLRALAEEHGVPETRSVSSILQRLGEMAILDSSSVAGLRELITAGNRAAHGSSVDPRAAGWAIDQGPAVLSILDEKLQA